MEHRRFAEASDVQDRAEQLECVSPGIFRLRFSLVPLCLHDRLTYAASCASLSTNQGESEDTSLPCTYSRKNKGSGNFVCRLPRCNIPSGLSISTYNELVNHIQQSHLNRAQLCCPVRGMPWLGLFCGCKLNVCLRMLINQLFAPRAARDSLS